MTVSSDLSTVVYIPMHARCTSAQRSSAAPYAKIRSFATMSRILGIRVVTLADAAIDRTHCRSCVNVAIVMLFMQKFIERI
jgi:hypothetical protein